MATCKNCEKQASYGIVGTTNREYCFSHKTPEMVNIKDKICQYLGCTTRATFGIQGTSQALYCASHRKDNMIDIKNKKCIYNSCKTVATFGIYGTKCALYCKEHSPPEMVNVKDKTCKECPKIPCFGVKGTKTALYCRDHQKQGMVNVKDKTCKNEWCDTQVKNKYNGYCYFCFVHMFPHHELTKSYKTKEKAVVDFVKNEFPDIDFICDKQIYDGCSKKRPDMFADFGDWGLIIEVDENEHTGYTCENKRLMQLSQDIDHRPLTIIRFNPDKYTKDDVKVASCWRNTKNGTKLVSTKTNEWTERLERLKRRIQRAIDNPSDQTIKLYNLFFSK